jgi:hypothetical protein
LRYFLAYSRFLRAFSFFWLFLAMHGHVFNPLSNEFLVRRAATLEALAAIDGLGTGRLERHLRLHAAAGADGIVHLARGAVATTSAATTTATGSLGRVTAGFAFAGLLEAFLREEVLLSFCENESIAAGCAVNVLVHCRYDCLFWIMLNKKSFRDGVLLATTKGIMLSANSARKNSNFIIRRETGMFKLFPSAARPSCQQKPAPSDMTGFFGSVCYRIL